jgi:hypothetical protein
MSKREYGTLDSLLTALRMYHKTGQRNLVFQSSDTQTAGRDPPAIVGKNTLIPGL